MEFVKTVLQENFIVKKIITIHYFEFNKDFCYVGEKHDFWELVYVDRGEAAVLADDTWHRVGQGKMAFHKPGATFITHAHAPRMAAPHDEYEDMWRAFYDAVTIESRLNPRLRDGWMPRRYHKETLPAYLR